MLVFIANPPWWKIDPSGGRPLVGVRGGLQRSFLTSTRSAPDRRHSGEYCHYPELLASGASWLAARPGARVRFHDGLARRESRESFIQTVVATRPDFIVLASCPAALAHDLALVRRLQSSLPGTRFALCGPFAAADVSGRKPAGPAILPAECEHALVALVNGDPATDTGSPLATDELEAAPAPWIDESHFPLYFDPVPHGELSGVLPRQPQGQVATARPGRMLSLERIGSRLEDLHRRFSPGSFYMTGDGDDLAEDRLLALADRLRALRTQWSVPLSASRSLSLATWTTLRRAGCHGVRLAMDPAWITCPTSAAFSPVKEACEMAKSLGIAAHAGFLHPAWGDHPVAKRAALNFLGGIPACHSVQDLAPAAAPAASIEPIEIRTPFVERSLAA
jgi:hypothetical protein